MIAAFKLSTLLKQNVFPTLRSGIDLIHLLLAEIQCCSEGYGKDGDVVGWRIGGEGKVVGDSIGAIALQTVSQTCCSTLSYRTLIGISVNLELCTPFSLTISSLKTCCIPKSGICIKTLESPTPQGPSRSYIFWPYKVHIRLLWVGCGDGTRDEMGWYLGEYTP